MLNSIIIDDEPLAGQLLADYVSRTEGIALQAVFTNPITALQSLDEYSVDFILLDVQMPALSGIQLARIVQGKYPVILTTAYEKFALEGYELDVVDYLLKPISFARFQAAVEKLKSRQVPIEQPISTLATATPRDYIFIKSGYQTKKIAFDDVLYLESLSDYVKIQTRQGAVLTLDNLKHLAEALPAHRFMRVHRSYIVALDRIDYIENNRIFIQDKPIPVSASYQERFWNFVKNER